MFLTYTLPKSANFAQKKKNEWQNHLNREDFAFVSEGRELCN